nr:MAG TPA: hypothetical protein [Caudoviricetes sp.]
MFAVPECKRPSVKIDQNGVCSLRFGKIEGCANVVSVDRFVNEILLSGFAKMRQER